MSATGKFSVSSSIQWRESIYNTQRSAVNLYQIVTDYSVNSGTGVTDTNRSYFTTGTIEPSGTLRFDLFNLTGENQNLNLSGGQLRLLVINNATTALATGNTHQNIVVQGTGVAGLIDPFESGYLGMTIKPYNFKVFSDVTGGYNITTGQRYFYINSPSGTAYNLAIVGRI